MQVHNTGTVLQFNSYNTICAPPNAPRLYSEYTSRDDLAQCARRANIMPAMKLPPISPVNTARPTSCEQYHGLRWHTVAGVSTAFFVCVASAAVVT